MAIQVADLAHLTTHFDVHERWVEVLSTEFFLQGDRERALRLPITPMMDRHKPGILKSQVSYFPDPDTFYQTYVGDSFK